MSNDVDIRACLTKADKFEMTKADIIREFPHKCIIVKIKDERVREVGSIYEAVRYCWKAKIDRAQSAELVLATIRGSVVGVYKPILWYRCTSENIERYGGVVSPDRIAFIGHQADTEIASIYLGKTIPSPHYGSQNPINYTYSYSNENIDYEYINTARGSRKMTLKASLVEFSNAFINEEDKHRIFALLMARFKNGFRTSSNIDFERFANYFAEEYGEDFKYDSSLFNKLLKTEALNFDDRAYVYNSETLSIVRYYLIQMNASCVFIDSFYSKHMSELYSFNIFSVEMLRAFIEKNYRDISVKWNYIYLQGDVSPSDLIDEVFCEREAWSYDELQERLPHLKMDTIRQTLNGSQYFRIAKGTYTRIDNMDLPEDEGAKIVGFVATQFMERDYVIANKLDLVKLENLNPHCPFSAIRDAVFVKFLSDKYDKCGQIITRKGEKLRVLDILEQYCLQAGVVTLGEFNTFAATFNPEGGTDTRCLIAGHNVMVRVSEELFVSDDSVDFDIARIDEVLALYCVNNFIPLRGVIDFSLLPYPGYQWNWFLLESYVRRFSQMFKFDVRVVNSANIGAIVRKTFAYNDYDEILALALAKSSIELNDKVAVGNYLFDAGYIGWHNLGKNEKSIIQRAKTFRKGGVA